MRVVIRGACAQDIRTAFRWYELQRTGLGEEFLQSFVRTLTVIHNYALKRRDGTTAAERFSGRKHNDLFAHLLTLAPTPARPRIRRRSERPDLIAA